MINKIGYLIIFIFILLSCDNNDQTENYYLENSKSDKLDSLALRYLSLNRFSGTIVVAKDGHSIYSKSFGLADYENKIPFHSTTSFKIGEITQLVTTNILERIVKQEKIEHTENISNYIDNIENDITIGDLIKQNSDIDNKLKGRLIEQISKKSYQENVETYCYDLELQNTYFQKDDSSSAIGYLYHNFKGDGLELQKSPAYNLEEVFSSKGLKSTGDDLIKILNYNKKDISINGYLENDGFSYSVFTDIKNKLSIIVLSNRRHPITEEISNSIRAILANKNYSLPLLREPIEIDKSLLSQYSGNYSLNENISFEVQIINDSLYVLLGPNKIFLVPQSSNQFYMIETDASMRFLRDSTNLVDRVELLNGFIESDQIAKKEN